MPLSELEQEFYAPQAEQNPTPESEPVVTPENETVETPAVAEVVVETPAQETPVIPEPIVETLPPYKSKKFVEVEDEKALYERLNQKYQYEKFTPEQKAMAYIAHKNPGVDDKDLLFIAATDYGIGIDPIPTEELTEDQQINLRKQEIARKRLVNDADEFFTQQASTVELPNYDPLDLDPDYKQYRTQAQAQQAELKQQEARIMEFSNEIETNAKNISEIKVPIEIDLDESKFAIDVSFKPDAAKQAELADYAKRYTPTDAEVSKFTEPSTGKFDFKGYMEHLATRVFAPQINTAALRQALATDRANFIEKELKNSSLRNNDVSRVVDREFDLVDAWKFGG